MTNTIELHHITKVEGHAHLTIKVDSGEVEKCELMSIEGARYFQGMLLGRRYDEAYEITSRICGICSVAHNIASIQAMDNALGIKVTEQTKKLRDLLMIGERIRSHAAHLYFLALPDYLGYESALAMAPKYKKEIVLALKMMKLGNEIVEKIGGRVMHPVSATLGGFKKLPSQEYINKLVPRIKECKDDAIFTAKLFAKISVPDFERKTNYMSLVEKDSYAIISGELKAGDDTFTQEKYLDFLREYQVPYGTANFVVKDDKEVMVGALPRLNHSMNQLSEDAKNLVEKSGIKFPNYNPFINNYCQAVELVHYIDAAVELCENLKLKDEKPVAFKVKAGHGVSAVEAPRGTLIHEYKIDDNGKITHANIITPTAFSLKNMETDIKQFLPGILNKDKVEIIIDIEKLIRSYDPCFSCSSHFLDVKWE